MLEILDKTYSFDDVLLIPNHSKIRSRLDSTIDISTKIGNTKLDIPIISANMDTVTELDMAKSIRSCGGLGIFHRFYKSKEKYHAQIKDYQISTKEVPYVSIGLKTSFEEIKELMDLFHTDKLNLCLDIANADNENVLNYISNLLINLDNKVNLIVGNICTKQAAVRLINIGVKTFKVGIGPDSACTTRIQTGHGIPQLSAIHYVKEAIEDLRNPKDYHIIADGGIKNSGDIVKALAAGASSVMIGKVLASCNESPAPLIYHDGHSYKEYRGQSSYKFQKDNNIHRPDITPEGECFFIDSTGPVKDTIDLLVGGIRSGMSYAGALNLRELYLNSRFVEISNAGLKESYPHGKNK